MDIFDPQFPHRFQLFTPSHVVTMISIAVLWVAVPLAFRRWKNDRADAILRYLLAILLVSQYLGWMAWEAVTGRFTLQTSLPLNMCDMSNFLLAVLLIGRRRLLYEILYFWALAGTIQSFITPNITFAFPHFEFIVFYIQHGGEILAILYLTVVSGLRPRPSSIVKSFGVLVAFLVVVYAFNLVFGANYMFLMADTPQPSTVTRMIGIFGAPPRHVIGLGLVAVVSMLVLYLPFAIMDVVARLRGRRGSGGRGLPEAGPGPIAMSLMTLVACLVTQLGASLVAAVVQRDSGRVVVANVAFSNEAGVRVRAKLLGHASASEDRPAPGVIYVPGYQSNRETGDPNCIELARRGFVVLCLDAIGRGNSGVPGYPDQPGFDPTFGVRASLAYIRSLPLVDRARVGLVGHSIGGDIAYHLALEDRSVRALVVTGYAYTDEASADRPANMLMIFGTHDEFRKRMTGMSDYPGGWMRSPRARRAIPAKDPELGVTYGSFDLGTARRVFAPRVTHTETTHCREAIAQTLEWLRSSLHPPADAWIDSRDQTWPVKEWATLVALVASIAALVPLGMLGLAAPPFRSLVGTPPAAYACTRREYLRLAGINGLVVLLYLPLVLILFALIKYVVPIDRVFPMPVVDAIVWWFFWINAIGLLLLRRWHLARRKAGPSLADMGISFASDRLALDWRYIARASLLALVLFAAVYVVEHAIEALFLVDLRFVFPYASDLTPYRAGMMALYLPFLLFGFLQTGFFIHGQIRPKPRSTTLGTWASWSISALLPLVAPLLVILAAQYVPILAAGVVPLAGPGGVLSLLIINVFHIIGVLLLVMPVSTWFFVLTGRPYLGAAVCALVVAWMFASSQVIAPIAA